MQASTIEREALHDLPGLLAGLLGIEPDQIHFTVASEHTDQGFDATAEAKGRRWMFEVKTSSSPGIVATAADRLNQTKMVTRGSTPVLVVPFMTVAGANVASERNLNWIDLAGNARLRQGDLYVWVEGRPNRFPRRGRPSTPFAPKSARISRTLLSEPWRWWRQMDLAAVTKLDDGQVSRIVRRLDDDELLDRGDGRLRPRDPDVLLDAWADDYRFDRHDVVTGHMSGTGMQLTSELHRRLTEANVDHAFTGLPAAWAFDRHARFRLCSVYVEGDPRDAATAVGLRRNEKGANVQLIGPDDPGVFQDRRQAAGYPCVSPLQVYLDLRHLPERAAEAAQQLRADNLLWRQGE